MPYKTLLVHLDTGQPNAGVLAVAAALAQRHAAGAIGIAACEPVQIAYVDGDYSNVFAAVEQQIVDDELKAVAAEFAACEALRPHVLEWRGIATLEPVAQIVAHAARCADLVITGISTGRLDATRHADTGQLVLRAGRPVLVVPPRHATANFATVLVAWNDTRECRRAIADALPLLRDAERVIVVGVGSDLPMLRAGIDDVIEWLGRHSISADTIVAPAGPTAVDRLTAIVNEQAADLIVAGAYGHNRLAEWAFGGVTRSLLLGGTHCALLSH